MSKRVLSVCGICGNVYKTFEEAYKCCMYAEIEKKYKRINNCQFPKELDRNCVTLIKFYDFKESELADLVALAERFDYNDLSEVIYKSQLEAKRKSKRYVAMYSQGLKKIEKVLERCIMDEEN